MKNMFLWLLCRLPFPLIWKCRVAATPTPGLASFYRDYNRWLEDNAPTDNPYGFSRSAGLCFNLSKHCGPDPNLSSAMLDLFSAQLGIVYGEGYYPFNEGDCRLYTTERSLGISFLNPKRRKFVQTMMKILDQKGW